MSKLLRKPIVQFILAGIILFSVQQLSENLTTNKPIEITKQTFQHIHAELSVMGLDAKDSQIVQNAVENKIEQELLSRFALDNGFEENNELVKSALAQTSEEYIQSQANLRDPGDEKLKEFLGKSDKVYKNKTRISFRQYFFGEDLIYAQKSLFDSKSISVESSETNPAKEQWEQAPLTTISRTFGKQFTDSLIDKPAEWRGIVNSEFGAHVVVIDAVFPMKQATLDDVRHIVLSDYRQQVLINYRDSILSMMRDRVEVVKDF